MPVYSGIEGKGDNEVRVMSTSSLSIDPDVAARRGMCSLKYLIVDIYRTDQVCKPPTTFFANLPRTCRLPDVNLIIEACVGVVDRKQQRWLAFLPNAETHDDGLTAWIMNKCITYGI